MHLRVLAACVLTNHNTSRDCALDDSCVLCSRCFHATDHTDHNVSFFIAQQSGGCCDCGDVGAWCIPIACPYHPPGAETPSSLVAFAAENPLVLLGRSIPPVENYPHRVPVPPELRDSMARTVAYALDFVLETLDCSPDETSVPTNEADLRLQPSADPMMKDHYSVVLWNDEKHSFTEVIDLLCSLTPTPRDEATEIANRIDDLGRDVIEMSTDVPRVLDVAQKIAQIELGVTVRRAYDTFREQVVAVIIEWLLDLTRARLGTDTVVLKEVIAEELLVPRRRSNAMVNLPSEVLSIETEVPDAVRITWLYLYHTKLWKKPRLSLKEIYASILGLSHQHKLSVGMFLYATSCLALLNDKKLHTLLTCTLVSSIITFSSTGRPKRPSNTLLCNYLPFHRLLCISFNTTTSSRAFSTSSPLSSRIRSPIGASTSLLLPLQKSTLTASHSSQNASCLCSVTYAIYVTTSQCNGSSPAATSLSHSSPKLASYLCASIRTNVRRTHMWSSKRTGGSVCSM